MKIDITPYEHFKPTLFQTIETYDLDRAVQFAVLSSVPLIAIYIYLQEEFGGFEEKIADLTEFYDYTNIIREK